MSVMEPVIVVSDSPNMASTLNLRDFDWNPKNGVNDTGAPPLHVTITPENGSPDDLVRNLTFCTWDRLPIGRASTSAGKSLKAKPDNMYLDSPIISRRHAELFIIGSKLCIQDAGSSHGTYVNGRRLTPDLPVTLTSGDFIRFGINISRDLESFDPPKYKITFPRDALVVQGRSFSVPVDLEDDSDGQSVSEESVADSDDHDLESASDSENHEDEEQEEAEPGEESDDGIYDTFQNSLSPIPLSVLEEARKSGGTMIDQMKISSYASFPAHSLDELEALSPIRATVPKLFVRPIEHPEGGIMVSSEETCATLCSVGAVIESASPTQVPDQCPHLRATTGIIPEGYKEQEKTDVAQKTAIEAGPVEKNTSSEKVTETVVPPVQSVKRKHSEASIETEEPHIESSSPRPIKKARSNYTIAATAAAAGMVFGSIGTIGLLASLPVGIFD